MVILVYCPGNICVLTNRTKMIPIYTVCTASPPKTPPMCNDSNRVHGIVGPFWGYCGERRWRMVNTLGKVDKERIILALNVALLLWRHSRFDRSWLLFLCVLGLFQCLCFKRDAMDTTLV